MTPETDRRAAALLARAQAGDGAAYDALLHLLAAIARDYVARRTSGAHWTEDVVQDVLLTVHRARHTFEPSRPFAPWFYAIVSSRLVDTVRARRRHGGREIVDEAALSRAEARSTAPADAGLQRALADAVAALPKGQRDVVTMLKYEDRSVRDVAAALDMSEANVKTTAHRGYVRLRALLKGLTGGHPRPDEEPRR